MDLDEARARLTGLAATTPPTRGQVHLSLDGPVAHVVIDAPATRNAMNVWMMVELCDAVARLAAWGGAGIVVRGEGGTFCSGGHLGDVQQSLSQPDQGRAMSLAMTAVLDALFELPAVSIAAIEGVALGGGAELACACDFRIGSRSSRIQFVQRRLGVACGWGGAARLVSLVGRRAALAMLADGGPVDAESAVAVGLFDAIADDPALEAVRRIDAWMSAGPLALRAVKCQVRSAVARDGGEVEAFVSVWGGDAHRAALTRIRGDG